MAPLYAVVGPTASGKSRFAIDLALALGGEVISCDSMQIYRGMIIGSGAVTDEEARGVPHHMLGVVSPLESYSAARFAEEARALIADIEDRGKTPILCGGTGLYVDSVLYDMDFAEVGTSDAEVRERLKAELAALGEEALHERLRKVDPEAAEKIHPHNAKRVLRALEVLEVTGKPFSSFRQETYSERRLIREDVRMVGLRWDRAVLRERIAKRVRQMIQAGLADEVRALLRAGVTPESQAMQGLGYRQMLPYLAGNISLEEAEAETVLRTCQYAKRQMTWFAREKRIEWLDGATADAGTYLTKNHEKEE